MRTRLGRTFAFVATLTLAALARSASSHEGPPYAMIVDHHVGPYTVSVWGDPDVGTGTFFVIFDPDAYRSAGDPLVALEVWPATGRLAPTRHAAKRLPDHAYRAKIPFDREETWQVRLTVDGSRGRGADEFPVAVTPPGYGRWDLLIYLGPFLLVAGLWVAVTIKRRQLVEA